MTGGDSGPARGGGGHPPKRWARGRPALRRTLAWGRSVEYTSAVERPTPRHGHGLAPCPILKVDGWKGMGTGGPKSNQMGPQRNEVTTNHHSPASPGVWVGGLREVPMWGCLWHPCHMSVISSVTGEYRRHPLN